MTLESFSISILHKYDYNTRGANQRFRMLRISILHKYDYNFLCLFMLVFFMIFQFYISTIIIVGGGSALVNSIVFQFYISTIIMADKVLDFTGTLIFQFYISTIIIHSPCTSCSSYIISILHKYDYNWQLHPRVPAVVAISILHKYDYNALAIISTSEVSLFQFYISTIIIVRRCRHRSMTTKFQFYISTIIIIYRFQVCHRLIYFNST